MKAFERDRTPVRTVAAIQDILRYLDGSVPVETTDGQVVTLTVQGGKLIVSDQPQSLAQYASGLQLDFED